MMKKEPLGIGPKDVLHQPGAILLSPLLHDLVYKTHPGGKSQLRLTSWGLAGKQGRSAVLQHVPVLDASSPENKTPDNLIISKQE